MNKKKDLLFSFFIKSIASFLVIINHTTSEGMDYLTPSKNLNLYIFIFAICKIAVPLFLMVTGFYLLRESKEFSMKQMLKQFFTFLLLFFLGTILYYALFDVNKEIPFLKYLYVLPITTIYWYMFLYLGIILMTPIFRVISKNATNREIIYLVSISFLFVSVLPMISSVFQWEPLNGHFTTSFFSMPIIYLFFGNLMWRIKHKLYQNKKGLALSGISIIIFWGIYIVLMQVWLKGGKSIHFWDQRYWPHIALLSSSVFIFIYILSSYIETKISHSLFYILGIVSKATLSVFLFSDHVIRFLRDFGITEILFRLIKIRTIANIVVALIVWATVILIGLLIGWLLNYIKNLKQRNKTTKNYIL